MEGSENFLSMIFTNMENLEGGHLGLIWKGTYYVLWLHLGRNFLDLVSLGGVRERGCIFGEIF